MHTKANTAKRHSKKHREATLADLHRVIVRMESSRFEGDEDSLEQPSPLKIVQSTTTYGVEETIMVGGSLNSDAKLA